MENIIQFFLIFRRCLRRLKENPIRHLRCCFLRKQLKAESRLLFSQEAPSKMFDWVLNTPLIYTLLFIWNTFISNTRLILAKNQAKKIRQIPWRTRETTYSFCIVKNIDQKNVTLELVLRSPLLNYHSEQELPTLF